MKTCVNSAINIQMDVFIAESKACHLSELHLKRAASLRAQIESLHSQIQRDGFVLEQISLKTKTPYVQFTLTKRMSAYEGAATPGNTSATEGAASAPSDATTGTGGVTTALSAMAGTTATAVASALAADIKDPMSLPPM